MAAFCNQCKGLMVPTLDSIVPALACVNCGRVIPATAYRQTATGSKAELNRVLRSARRQRMKNDARQ